MYINNIHVSFPYIDSLNILVVQRFHLSTHVVLGVFDFCFHARHLLSFKTVQLSVKVFDLGLLLLLLELHKNQVKSQVPVLREEASTSLQRELFP